MGSFRTRAIRMLATHGIPEPTPEGWYSWQRYLDTVREIADTVGPATLSRIGRLLVDQDEFADGASLESVLRALDPAYKSRHRARDAGDFHYEPTGPRSARMLVRNPYPCELDLAVITALAVRFRPAEALTVQVRHRAADECRSKGAAACDLEIRW